MMYRTYIITGICPKRTKKTDIQLAVNGGMTDEGV